MDFRYLNTHSGWTSLVELFRSNGYILDLDLSNEIYFYSIENPEDENLQDYDSLPETLKSALDDFTSKHHPQ